MDGFAHGSCARERFLTPLRSVRNDDRRWKRLLPSPASKKVPVLSLFCFVQSDWRLGIIPRGEQFPAY
jgi:hypothetical protein